MNTIKLAKLATACLGLLLLALIQSSCGGGGNEGGNPPPKIKLEKTEAEFKPLEAFGFEIENIAQNGHDIEAYIDGQKLTLVATGDVVVEFVTAIPLLAASSYNLEVLIDGELISVPLTVTEQDFNGKTQSEYLDDSFARLIQTLSDLIDSGELGEFEDDARQMLAELENIDQSEFTAEDIQILAHSLAANAIPQLDQLEQTDEPQTQEKSVRVFPQFDSSACNSSRNDYLFAALVTYGSVAALVTAPFLAKTGPVAAFIGGISAIAFLKGRQQMIKYADEVVNHCVANYGDAILVGLLGPKSQPLIPRQKSSAGITIELTRFEEQVFNLSRNLGVEENTQSLIAGRSQSLKRKLSVFVDDENSNFISRVASGLIAVIDRLFEVEEADRLTSEFNFQFDGVDVEQGKNGQTITLVADIENHLDKQTGRLLVTDTTDDHVSEFDVEVLQILPIACPLNQVEDVDCKEAASEYELPLEGELSGKLEALYNVDFQITAQPQYGQLQLNPTTGDFTYRVTEGSGSAEFDYFTFVTENGAGKSNAVTIQIELDPVPKLLVSSFNGTAGAAISDTLESNQANVTFRVIEQAEYYRITLNSTTGQFSYSASNPTGGYHDSFVVELDNGRNTAEYTVALFVEGPSCVEHYSSRVVGGWTVRNIPGPGDQACSYTFSAFEGGAGEYTSGSCRDHDGNTGFEDGKTYGISWQIYGAAPKCYFEEDGFWHSGGYSDEPRDALGDSSLDFYTYSKFNVDENGNRRQSRHYSK